MYLGLPLTAVMAVIIIVYFLINKLGIAIKFLPLLICGVMGLFLGLVLPRFLVPQLSMAGTILLVLFSMFLLSVVLAWIFGKEEYSGRQDKSCRAAYKPDGADAVLLPEEDSAMQPTAAGPELSATAAVSAFFADADEKRDKDDGVANDCFEPALLNAPSFNVLRYAEPAIEKIAAKVFPAQGKIRPSGFVKSFKEDEAAIGAVCKYDLACDGVAASGKEASAYGGGYGDGWFSRAGEKIATVLGDWKLPVAVGREISPASAEEPKPANGGNRGGEKLPGHCNLPPQSAVINSGPFTDECFAADNGVCVYAGCFADVPVPSSRAADDAVAVGCRERYDIDGQLAFAGCSDGQSDCFGIGETYFNQDAGAWNDYAEKTEDAVMGAAPIYPCLAADGDEQGSIPAADETCGRASAEEIFAQGGQESSPAAETHRVSLAGEARRLAPEKEPGSALAEKAFAGGAGQEGALIYEPRCAYAQKHCEEDELPYRRQEDEKIKVVEKKAQWPLPAEQIPKSDSFDDLLDFAFTQKEQGNWAKALHSLQMAYAMYPMNDFALLIIVETANIYKQMGNYDMAIAELQKGIEKTTVANMRHDFILNIGYLRIIKNILKTHNIALLPYNQIPDKVKEDIEKEYLDWKNSSQQ
ncbi:MAG: hypothetical protein LBO03_08980 [Acidaminococcales bacterium]|jgi:tetratricopeptide (TPR) repeat protein|nr:hypothetical protein [Acidaminococcales bacterium]